MAGHWGHNWCFASMRGQFACAIVQMLTVCRIEWAQSQLKDGVFIKYLFNLFMPVPRQDSADTAVTEHTSPRHATPPQPCPAHFPDKLKRIKSILAFVHNVKLYWSICEVFLDAGHVYLFFNTVLWSWKWGIRISSRVSIDSHPVPTCAGAWAPVSVVCAMGSWLFMFSVDVI